MRIFLLAILLLLTAQAHTATVRVDYQGTLYDVGMVDLYDASMQSKSQAPWFFGSSCTQTIFLAEV